jgi:poly(glycerol-phosphate) alpha-glucosyltransferase
MGAQENRPLIKIGQLTPWLTDRGGGVSVVVLQLSNALQKIGLNVYVFGPINKAGEHELGDWGELNLSAHKTRFFYGLWGFSSTLYDSICDNNLSILHQHGIWKYPSVLSSRWSKKTKKPYIISPHGMIDTWALNYSKFKKYLSALLYQNKNFKEASCLHALNKEEAMAMRSYGLCKPIAVVPNGVSLPRDGLKQSPQWKERLPDGAKVLLFLGRIHPKKGLLNLLDAWAQVYKKTEKDGWHLVIAGWDERGHQNELKQKAFALGIERNVLFVGPQFGDNKDASYKCADAFILPSLSEGLPMVVLEAWSYGLPVLMTGACNLKEGFSRGAALLLPHEKEGMAEVLSELFDLGQKDRFRIGFLGKQIVEENYTWERVALQMQEIYTWVLGGGSAPGNIIDANDLF